nr:MAG TPA: hypothetical protein [Caudoviricetes sp.]
MNIQNIRTGSAYKTYKDFRELQETRRKQVPPKSTEHTEHTSNIQRPRAFVCSKKRVLMRVFRLKHTKHTIFFFFK